MENIGNLKSSEDQDSSEFINVGLQNWESGRQKWLDYNGVNDNDKVDVSRCFPSAKKKKSGATSLNVDKIIDLIVSNRWRNATKGGQKEKEKATFEKPVPLPQMIDILVDLWEAEGMDA